MSGQRKKPKSTAEIRKSIGRRWQAANASEGDQDVEGEDDSFHKLWPEDASLEQKKLRFARLRAEQRAAEQSAQKEMQNNMSVEEVERKTKKFMDDWRDIMSPGAEEIAWKRTLDEQELAPELARLLQGVGPGSEGHVLSGNCERAVAEGDQDRITKANRLCALWEMNQAVRERKLRCERMRAEQPPGQPLQMTWRDLLMEAVEIKCKRRLDEQELARLLQGVEQGAEEHVLAGNCEHAEAEGDQDEITKADRLYELWERKQEESNLAYERMRAEQHAAEKSAQKRRRLCDIGPGNRSIGSHGVGLGCSSPADVVARAVDSMIGKGSLRKLPSSSSGK